MYRLLVVDDEEIITDGLYEVFSRWMPDKLDVCKAYSGKEALRWMERTRIDIVLTDIRMPGMSGLELTETIQACWPRCRIVFLTGYSEFDYAYKAIQMPNARYLLKTEGYDKVLHTVGDIMREIEQGNEMSKLLERSHEQSKALEHVAQSELVRQWLKDSQALGGNAGQPGNDSQGLGSELRRLNIALEPGAPVLLVLGRMSYRSVARREQTADKRNDVKVIWDSFMSAHIRSIGVEDAYGDTVWLVQPLDAVEEANAHRLVLYMEGTLELIQEACLASLDVHVAFTIATRLCAWEDVAPQYERLRQLQQMKIGDGVSMIIKDMFVPLKGAPGKESIAVSRTVGMLEAHLEAERKEEFTEELERLVQSLDRNNYHMRSGVEAYYSVAVLLLAQMNRHGLQAQRGDSHKLLRLDEHPSIHKAFQYLQQTADDIFAFKQMDDRDKTIRVIDRICTYIEEHLGEDVSLVRLAEVHYFNPSYLSRLFKQERGMNLSEYIDKCRIRQAKELLGNGDLKVREVALLVGYDAAHSFTRFFKKATGLTPQEYRDSISG